MPETGTSGALAREMLAQRHRLHTEPVSTARKVPGISEAAEHCPIALATSIAKQPPSGYAANLSGDIRPIF